MNGAESCETSHQAHGLFLTTRWSVVLKARDKASPGFQEAMETLCQTYWYPAYAFVRSKGHSPADAQDLTQDFFVRLLSKDFLRLVDPDKGRFRTFLKTALSCFLANEWDRVRAKKRGGAVAHVQFDTLGAEEEYQSDHQKALSPDVLYERDWALALLDQSRKRLEAEYTASNKSAELQALIPHLTADHGGIPYAQLAQCLGTSEGAVRVAICRMRKHFRELFRATVAETVSDSGQLEDELRHILEILRNPGA